MKLSYQVTLLPGYTFDGNVKDHSGNGNDVFFNNATPARGKSDKENSAFKFNGSSSYMRAANSTSLQMTREKGLTLVALFKVEGF